MKKRLSLTSLLLVMIMVFATACGKKAAEPDLFTNADTVKNVTIADVIKTTQNKDQKDKILVIDVRPQAEYEAGHVLNSINIAKENIAAMIPEIADYKEKPVILYSSDDTASKAAADAVLKEGFKNVSVATGIKDVKAEELYKFENITGQTFEKMLGEKADMVVLDIRPDKDLANGFIEGSVHIPLDALKTRLAEVPKDKKIVVYCNTGTKSVDGAKILHEAGYNVVNVVDGTKEFTYKELKKN